MAPFTLITKLDKKIPLTIKMVSLVGVVGLFLWFISDSIQTQTLKQIFHTQLSERLSEQAMQERLFFDRYIKAHSQVAKVFASQRHLINELEKKKWSQQDTFKAEYHREYPAWLPERSVLHTLIYLRYVLLLDAEGRLREVYKELQEDTLPQSLLKPTNLLIQLSTGQNYITTLEGSPYLITSEPIQNNQGRLLGTLSIACPIDDMFLIASQNPLGRSNLVALLTEGKSRILISNNKMLLPPDTMVNDLEGYMMVGSGFLDYGSSDIELTFASFVSTEEVGLLAKRVISPERRLRFLIAIVFIFSSMLFMLWITRRIHRLSYNIEKISQSVLGISPKFQKGSHLKGDQLCLLEERFHHLIEEIKSAHALLKRETEDRLLEEKKIMEIQRREKELKLLQLTTQTLGVGVIARTPHGLRPANEQMVYFVKCCGGLSQFEIEEGDSVERSLSDTNGQRRVFQISSPTAFEEEKIILVSDITELKLKTEAIEYLAMHDPLTDLPNRRLFYDRLQQTMLLAQREKRPFALLMIDLNRFKEINDTLGHIIGDMALKEIGTRLQGAMRKSDTVARIGGDEFTVVLPGADSGYAEQAIKRLINAIEQPIVIGDNKIYIGASAGIALYPEHGGDTDALFRHADTAMYLSKQSSNSKN